jgi:hypothetical protein
MSTFAFALALALSMSVPAQDEGIMMAKVSKPAYEATRMSIALAYGAYDLDYKATRMIVQDV